MQDVSFSVQENETVALIGPNGAGKTTSFHLMTGFHRPDSGSVLAFGREIVGLRPHDICALGLARMPGDQEGALGEDDQRGDALQEWWNGGERIHGIAGLG